MRSHYRIIHSNVFEFIILTTATLARWNSALPDDDDCHYTETCCSCFNVNFDVNLNILRQFNCESVGKQIKMIHTVMLNQYVRIYNSTTSDDTEEYLVLATICL